MPIHFVGMGHLPRTHPRQDLSVPPLPPTNLPRPALSLCTAIRPASFDCWSVHLPVLARTTLAIEYFRGVGSALGSVWISLDSHDGDPGQLLRSLIQGLRTLTRRLGAKELLLCSSSA